VKFYEFKAISLRNPTVWAEKSPLNGCFSPGESVVLFRKIIKVNIRKGEWKDAKIQRSMPVFMKFVSSRQKKTYRNCCVSDCQNQRGQKATIFTLQD
jgi:hypothetical protein